MLCPSSPSRGGESARALAWRQPAIRSTIARESGNGRGGHASGQLVGSSHLRTGLAMAALQGQGAPPKDSRSAATLGASPMNAAREAGEGTVAAVSLELDATSNRPLTAAVRAGGRVSLALRFLNASPLVSRVSRRVPEHCTGTVLVCVMDGPL